MGTTTALRASDLLTLPDPPRDARYELSEGELIIVPGAGFRHEFVKGNIHRLLTLWDPELRHGRVFGESTFPLSDDTARRPDVAFVANDRLSGVKVDDELIPFVPNLAIEVISKSEPAEDAERKVQQYLASGVGEVWQVYPESRIVHVRTAGNIREFRADQSVESAVLPGFSAAVSRFFA
jgi:Uma2 family endonuclease